MCDFTLARMPKLPVSLLITGLLYCRDARVVGQAGEVMNLVDLALLPVTPVMGDGSAPLQPLEVGDCAARIAALALGEASLRVRHESSQGLVESSWARLALLNQRLQYTLRVYDAVIRCARPGNGDGACEGMFQRVHGRERPDDQGRLEKDPMITAVRGA
mmetsp:Transcript_2560/g.9339  ORF Transcript_2560/g.9339 Transcript_2560/m.9339 type:complete len:160 (-) Transcript_2560:978-1457(-)